jgi:hypothetical protein
LDLSEKTMIERITKRAPLPAEELAKRLKTAVNERIEAAQYCSHVISAE